MAMPASPTSTKSGTSPERLAALRSDVEPIRGVHAQHTYWGYVADFPHVRCSLRLTVCQPSRRNGVLSLPQNPERLSNPLSPVLWARRSCPASGCVPPSLVTVLNKPKPPIQCA